MEKDIFGENGGAGPSSRTDIEQEKALEARGDQLEQHQ